MTRTIVTGGAGFLGSHLADELTARGHEVLIFDQRASPFLQSAQEQVVGDLLDFDLLRRTLQGADYVYHLGALADLNAARSRPRETASINVLGSVNLLEAARLAEVKRFVFASTVYVYSDEGSFYRASKQAGEAYIEEYQRQYGLEYTVLRYGSLYGPRADESNGVYRLLRAAALEGRIRYDGRPDDAREYIHVADAARLSVDILVPEYANQHLVITGHYPMRARDLFTMFSEILGHEIQVDYVEPETVDGHYRVTPYKFHPRVARKLTSTLYVDMGQGAIEVLEQIERERGRPPG
ncbi:MAG TPA: NAD(P)-dependent oxidoreductase [Anaerolineales bacterium]|nr:NAD(P)-dependent oxidoreductase [Anaerolineales bacterium]